MKQANRPLPIPGSIRDVAAEWLARRDDGLHEREETEFQSWLRQDPRHADAIARLRASWSALDRPLRAGAAAEVLDEIRRSTARRRQRRIGAAVASLAVLWLARLFWPGQEAAPPVATATAPAVVLLPEKRVLPDGSIVEMNRATAIAVQFDAHSTGARRVLLRQGEAHFAVAKDPGRPFVVLAGGVEFRAVGTAFAVQLGAEQVELLVTEGTVAVGRPATSGPPNLLPSAGETPLPLMSVKVAAGNLLLVELAQSAVPPVPVAVRPQELAERLVWRSARLEFTGAPLADAVELINQHSRVRFVLEDPRLGQEQISGLFRTDNTEGFVHMLEQGFGFEVVTRGEREIVLQKRR